MLTGSPVESVRRTFALLEELNGQRITSVQHLHAVTGLPKSTIVRLLETLRILGYVANDPRQGGYQVTSGVRSLSSGFHGDPLVVEAARPWAIEFTRQYKLPVGIAVFDRDAMVVRFSTISDSPMSPFHATINMKLRDADRAMGRAYLAFCPADRARVHPGRAGVIRPSRRSGRAMLRGGSRHHRPRAAQRLCRALARPWSQSHRIRSASRSCWMGEVLATIGLRYFNSSMPKAKAIAAYVPPLMDLAKNIESSVHCPARGIHGRETLAGEAKDDGKRDSLRIEQAQ